MNKDQDHTEQTTDSGAVEYFSPSANQHELKGQSDPQGMLEVDEDFSAPKELLQAQALANLLDTAVKIPFIGLRVGLDFLIGLIPGIGDTIMLLASMRIVFLARKMGLPSALQAVIFRTALIDYGLGFVPILGDIVDLFYKANQKNVRVMEKWWVTENKDKIDALAKKRVEQWHAEQALNNK